MLTSPKLARPAEAHDPVAEWDPASTCKELVKDYERQPASGGVEPRPGPTSETKAFKEFTARLGL